MLKFNEYDIEIERANVSIVVIQWEQKVFVQGNFLLKKSYL